MVSHLKRSSGTRWLGFILLATLTAASGLISSGGMFLSILRLAGQVRAFDPAAYERRFDGLKTALPPRGVVGYFNDRYDPVAREAGADLRYYLAQYALAPIVLTRQDVSGFVIGDFLGTPDQQEVALRKLAIVRYYGNGLLLYQSGVR